jgi:hypothetical protein
MTGVLPFGHATAYNRAYGHCSHMSPRIGTLDALVGTTALERTAAPETWAIHFRTRLCDRSDREVISGAQHLVP